MEDEVNPDDVDEIIEELIEEGILIEHIDPETGEKLYEVSREAESRAPDLWEVHTEDMRKAIYSLFMAGFVTMMFSEEGPMNDTVSLTDLAYDEVAIAQLDYFDQQYLKHLIKAFDNSN